MAQDFRTLRVYRLSQALSTEIWNAVLCWPSFARQALGGQIVRAADSVGANIAEGSGRATYRDNRRHVYIARGSLKETQHFLRLAHLRNLLTPEQAQRISVILKELGPLLNGYLRSLDRRAKQKGSDSRSPK